MRYLSILLLCLMGFFSANAQVNANGQINVKKGDVLKYAAKAPDGSSVDFLITVLYKDKTGVGFLYKVINGKKTIQGKCLVTPEGTKDGSSLNWDNLNPGEERHVSKDQTLFFYSQKFYKELVKNKKAIYGGTTYVLKPTPTASQIKINNKKVKSLYVTSQDGKEAFWILDNPDFPLLLNSTGNQQGPDMLLVNVGK
ncbi:hypothetical protein [Chitinophaga ginsengisoli]|uniref:Uncharacterized protein n=1 Tax=Chitinophaga ginsengisoli TaxID=363837 RepID=A0A2P8G7X1_9BACT|nr:hypothetical protein [Chitinophaga ginsengisoli]PSL30057.1 hypothetical protein CLV42_106394 [Chitinophaga ginsengisoli]